MKPLAYPSVPGEEPEEEAKVPFSPLLSKESMHFFSQSAGPSSERHSQTDTERTLHRSESTPLIAEALHRSGILVNKETALMRSAKPPKAPVAVARQHDVHLLSTFQLVAITFFAVAGGPYGFEDVVGAGGAKLMFLGLAAMPFVWALPLALMTTELACMIPESGGHVLWVYRAFGPFWSFLNSFFAFACSIFDNALYPVLFVDYLNALFYGASSAQQLPYGWSVGLKIVMVLLVTFLNVRGIDIVGTASIVFGAAVLAPFVVMIFWGLPSINFNWAAPSAFTTVQWGKFLTVLLWNTSGFDAAGTCASEVKNPAKAYPKALMVSVLLILGTYALPALVGVSVITDNAKWHDGTFVDVANRIGGRPLEVWMGMSAALSALGLLLTRLCTNSRLVYGMALIDQVPTVFSSLHGKYATPWAAILVTSFCTLLLTGFNFTALAEADMLFYALSTILKFGSLIQLRFTEPDAFRPFRIPLDNISLSFLMMVPVGLCLAMIWLAPPRVHGIGLLGTLIAMAGYSIKELCTHFRVQAEEAVEERMARVQDNLDRMQKRIDTIIQKEVVGGVQALGRLVGSSSHDSNLSALGGEGQDTSVSGRPPRGGKPRSRTASPERSRSPESSPRDVEEGGGGRGGKKEKKRDSNPGRSRLGANSPPKQRERPPNSSPRGIPLSTLGDAPEENE